MVSFAVWTVCFHVGLVFKPEVLVLLTLWLIVTGMAFVLYGFFQWRRLGGWPEGQEGPDRGVLWTAGVIAALAAGWLAGLHRDFGYSWVLACVVAGIAALLSLAGIAARALGPEGPRAPAWGTVPVLAAAAAAAVLSLSTVNTDGDDVFYVSRSIRTAETGFIPVKDAIFTQGAVGQISGEPPVPSFEVLVGGLARAFGVSAQEFLWFRVLPFVVFCSVWALWRLVREWAPRRAFLCFAVAAVYLLWTGAHGAAFGPFHLLRMWQGKAIFLSLLVPLIYTYLTRWASARSKFDLGMAGVAGVAATGLTTTSTFIVPLIVGGAVLALVLARKFFEAAWACLAAVYPVGAGLAVALIPTSNHEVTGAFYDAPHTYARVLLTGTMGVIAGVALWGGPWLARRGGPALMAAGASAVLTVMLIPGVLEFLGDTTGAAQIMWRMPWVAPIPALVGLIAAVPLPSRWLAPLPAAALIATIIPTGLPIWSLQTGTEVAGTPAWKVKRWDMLTVQQIARTLPDRAVVLAPQKYMRWFPLLTTRLNAVNPQSRHLILLPVDQRFRDDRELLTALTRYGTATMPAADVQAALGRVGVTYACVDQRNSRGQKLLQQSGYTRSARVYELVCFTPGTPTG
ncbi:hypothetical protein GCM10010468_56850 [Actinocorallia longicatena]|uniref:Uncharacterized protein n=1 Tax=Actinocorallia longicatena TaxID=111803 RepID=A0ABP6QHB8_9ACTN